MNVPENYLPHAAVIGGGLAGLSAALALGSSGCRVTLLESRPFLGGRATSYPLNTGEEAGPTIDNCQHVLLRCCTNLLDFYRRLGVEDRIRFHREFYWVEPGGRLSVMRSGFLPAPLHFAESFASLRFLTTRAKWDVARGLLAVRRDYRKRRDLDRITMLDWLREKKQGEQAIERFWRQVLVSAVNEELDRMAAIHGLQVFWLGFLARGDSYEMGIPNVPLGDLYSDDAWKQHPEITLRERATVEHVEFEGNSAVSLRVGGENLLADVFISSVPYDRLNTFAPDLSIDVSAFSHSPITGIHLWFAEPITDLPHATLLNRTIQWMFNKENGRHIQLVVSASRSLTEMPRQEVIALGLRELSEFFPRAASVKLERSHVVKEVRATFSAGANLEALRPPSTTRFANFFLAGDWTRSSWPATMEGAVRSGYLAAEAACRYLGRPQKFLVPDIA